MKLHTNNAFKLIIPKLVYSTCFIRWAKSTYFIYKMGLILMSLDFYSILINVGLILFILILKSEPNSTIYLGFNINGPISTCFNSKMGLYSTNYEIGLFSGLDFKLILFS